MEDKIETNTIRKVESSSRHGRFRPKYSLEVTIDGAVDRTNDMSQLNIGKTGSILNNSAHIDAEFEDVDYISDGDPAEVTSNKMD
tara:strand:- start:304 stop:558 length:255 start_codon:yes stop_codon:yes gene_type:complete